MSERFGLSLSLWDAHTNHSREREFNVSCKRRDPGVSRSHLELFCLVWGDLVLLGPLSLEAERDDERPLLQELLRCRSLALLRDSSFFLPDTYEWCPGEADGLRR